MSKTQNKSVFFIISLLVTGVLALLAVSFRVPSFFQTVLVIAFGAHLYFLTGQGVQKWARIAGVFGILGIGFPLIGFVNSLYLQVLIGVLIYSALALGLNVVVGFAGLLDLGYAAFFAVGAYFWAIFGSPQANNFIPGNHFPLNGNYLFVFIPLALLIAAGVGALLGLPVLKVKGDYLAIITLGLGEVIRVLANNLNRPVNITNGANGVAIATDSARPLEFITRPLSGLFNTEFYRIESLMFYSLGLIIVGFAILFAQRLDNSRIGRAWTAMREDEIAAQAMGIPLLKSKLIAFATGASVAGAMGALYASVYSLVSPESFSFQQSISILSMVVLGGLGSIRGVIVGAAILTTLNQLVLTEISSGLNTLRAEGLPLPEQLDPSKYQQFILGIILIVMMILRPKGLVPAKRNPAHLEDLEHGELAKGAK
jgi:branched-chain amino acid transport system permease protein